MSTRDKKRRRNATSKGGPPSAQPAGPSQRKSTVKPQARRPQARSSYRRSGGRGRAVLLAIGVGVAVLAGLFFLNRSGSAHSGKYAFEVGTPGPGEQAPDISLPSTAGGTFDLASLKGQTVLLYFQEGLTCQPCWDQLKDIDQSMGQLKALGIDQVVSVTTDPISDIQQKVSDEGISSPVLSDQDLAVSGAYHANSYGMMGDSRDGHSFILVGPDGQIQWRADYGGPPDFTMYLPVSSLVTDIKTGIGGSSTAGP